LYFFNASSEARITHDAPSVICELLPAVTLPHGRSKSGLSFAGRQQLSDARHRRQNQAVARKDNLLRNQPSFCAVASQRQLARLLCRLPP
jgi:hypothetical protein